MREAERTLEGLRGAIASPRTYGKKYLSAETRDDLLLALGEACCVAAFAIVMLFELPKRGSLILRIIKVFSRRAYDRYFYLYHFTFSHCLMYITTRLQNTIEPKIGSQAQEIAENAYAYGGVSFSALSWYSKADKDALRHEMEMRLLDHAPGQVIDEGGLLENIIAGLGRQVPPRQIAQFFRETIADDPLAVVEPFRFVDRYVEITG